MSTVFRRSRAVPQEAETRAQRSVARTVAVLSRYRRNGLVTVAIEDVLELLGTDPDSVPEERVTREPPRDPLADTLTGARWAGPPGTAPPG